MYYLCGARESLRNITRLVSRPGEPPFDPLQLRERYVDFCVEVGGSHVRPLADEDQITYNECRIADLLTKYKDQSALTDIRASVLDTPAVSRHLAMERVTAAKAKLSLQDPELCDFFDFFIHTLFYQRAHHSGGGSVSSALGVVWCAVNKKWSDEDINEFLVHELAHNLLFLDERTHRHYKKIEAISDKKNYALSAILRLQRPLDKVFHSLIVANEVLSFRAKHGEPENPRLHPPTHMMLKDANRTIESLDTLFDSCDLVYPRLMVLYEKARRSILTLKPNRLAA